MHMGSRSSIDKFRKPSRQHNVFARCCPELPRVLSLQLYLSWHAKRESGTVPKPLPLALRYRHILPSYQAFHRDHFLDSHIRTRSPIHVFSISEDALSAGARESVAPTITSLRMSTQFAGDYPGKVARSTTCYENLANANVYHR